MKRLVFTVALLVAASVQASKFEPRDGRILVIAGQSPQATLDYRVLPNTPRPAGFSDYVSYKVGQPYREVGVDEPRVFRGNEGLLQPVNWGSGKQCVDCLVRRAEFAQAVINIGLEMNGPKGEDGSMCRGLNGCAIARLARGEFDEQLKLFAGWLNSLDGRPVLLRPAYEFDGSWNNYDPGQFRAAWIHLHRLLADAGVSNVAWVYHTYGFASRETMDQFWPGDAYVDWIGYSYFQLDPRRVGQGELQFARDKGLKVFLGEVAPHTGDCKRQIDLASNTELGREWMDVFFRYVEDNRDVIRAIAYINDRWNNAERAPMWQDQQDHNCGGYFSRSNSRLNDNPVLEQYWAEKINRPLYLNLEPNLYDKLLMGGG
jgi:hypothetical protein